jgi:ABC-2 type transport system permease protein
VSWAHLQAFLWLRWRLMANHWRRAGALNAILMMIVVVGLLAMAVPLFAGCLAIGIYAFPKATPAHLLYAWDAMALGFVFFWGIGLMAELQRTETLSLSKFLHLPVSVTAAFLINYLSSLLSLTLVVFLPIMLGFGLALVTTKGPLLLVVAPLTAAFLLMVTSLTYQFQGWLATLMGNPRRRRTIIVMMTFVFVLLSQLPSLMTFWGPFRHFEQSHLLVEELNELSRDAQAGKIDNAELLRQQTEAIEKDKLANEEASREGAETLQHAAIWLNRILPIGWLPLGVMSAAEGNALPAALGFCGMTLIGGASLRRAYRTTIAIYQGQSTGRQTRAHKASVVTAPKIVSPAIAGQRRAAMLETRLPGLSDPVAAIALGGLKSLIRAPESKIMLMTPVLLTIFFGSAIFKLPSDLPASVRALLGYAAIGMALFGSLGMVANLFGFDRDGFRVFVLSAVPRRDILLGKNLAFTPLVLGMAAVMLIAVQIIRPLRWDHFLAMAPQAVSMFLLFCMLANLLSIYTPMHIAAGSLKPTQVKLLPVLLQMVMMFLLFPLLEAPTLLPLAIEAVLESQGWTGGAPICLLLTLALCAVVMFVYRLVLQWQGQLLQRREQIILETVTNRAP